MAYDPTVERLARRWNVDFRRGSQELLERYVELVAEWDRAHRLTGHRTRGALWEGLAVESMALASQLAAESGRLVDLGCGNGAPGLVVAVVSPGWKVLGIEAKLHRCSFLNHVRRELGLENFDVRRGRAEEPLAEEARGFDVATARAFGPLEQSLAVADRYLRPGGTFLAISGPPPPRGWRVERRASLATVSGRKLDVRHVVRSGE